MATDPIRHILVVTPSRAETVPLKVVLKELRDRYCNVHPVAPALPGFTGAAAGYTAALTERHFDLVLILGDRYESLAAAAVATVAGVPIAHIHGGEATFGSFDNQQRDAITKLASFHFVAAPDYEKRLRDLGEEDWRIWCFGAPGLDNLLNLPSRRPIKRIMACYHPATLVGEPSDIYELTDALDRFPDYEILWSTVNADPGNDVIREALVGRSVRTFDNPRNYHLACRHAACVVGNSSSALIEAPTLEVPSVNVGHRQDGRLRGPSVFDCEAKSEEIEAAIQCALEYDGPFTNPYGAPGASARIAEILAGVGLKNASVKSWS